MADAIVGLGLGVPEEGRRWHGSAVTDAAGAFELAEPPPPALRGVLGGYEGRRASPPVLLASGRTLVHDGMVLCVPEGTLLRGRIVVEGPCAAPMALAGTAVGLLALGPADPLLDHRPERFLVTATLDDEGRFACRAYPRPVPADVRLRFSLAGSALVRREVAWGALASEDGVLVRLPAAPTSFLAVDATSGAPLEGVTLTTVASGGEGTCRATGKTDAGGRCTLPVVGRRAGFCAEREGYASVLGEVPVGAESRLVLRELGTADVPAGIVLGAGGAPLADAFVLARPEGPRDGLAPPGSRSTRSDAGGRFALPAGAGTPFVVTASDGRSVSSRWSGTAPAGDVVLRLGAAGASSCSSTGAAPERGRERSSSPSSPWPIRAEPPSTTSGRACRWSRRAPAGPLARTARPPWRRGLGGGARGGRRGRGPRLPARLRAAGVRGRARRGGGGAPHRYLVRVEPEGWPEAACERWGSVRCGPDGSFRAWIGRAPRARVRIARDDGTPVAEAVLAAGEARAFVDGPD